MVIYNILKLTIEKVIILSINAAVELITLI